MQAVFNLAISVTNHGTKKDYISSNLLTNKRIKVKFHEYKTIISALQIMAGQRSITTNLQSLNAHTYHAMIIVTSGFFKKSFLLI